MLSLGAGMVQWWEFSPPTNVSRVRFRPGVICGLRLLLVSRFASRNFLRAIQFSLLHKKKQHLHKENKISIKKTTSPNSNSTRIEDRHENLSKYNYFFLYHIVPSVGPVIVAYRSTSSTSIYVQWNHSILQEQANGILIGYRVAWDDDHFSSQGYADVGLDTSMYDIISLYEHWLYNIRVAGRTSVGHGIYTVVTVMTNDSSKCLTITFS